MVSLDARPTGGAKRSKAGADEGSLVAVECRGSQGGVVFVFAPSAGDAARRRVSIVLADGSALPVELERDPVGWMLLDVHLVDRATLDYCNLSALALVGRVFVCYGPAGMFGVMSINGSAFDVTVPSGVEPLVSVHEGITVVVCNEDSVDAVWVDSGAVYVGASGLDASGQPVAHPMFKKVTRIAGSGETSVVASASATPRRPKVSMGSWNVCGTDELVSGKGERYAAIDGPTGMESLGASSGYGWVRLKFKGASRSVKGGFFESADRLHLYFDGEFHGLVGAGPGADDPVVTLPFKKGEHVVTVLIDNLGRRCEGDGIGERKGLFGHVVETAVFRAGAPKIVNSKSIEPLAHWPVVMGLEDGDATDPRRVTWRIQHRKKTPLIVRLGGLSDPAVLMLDGKLLRVLPRGTVEHVVLTPEMLSRGTNEVQVAVVGDIESALRVLKSSAVFYEGSSSMTAKAGWAFAKWEPPGATKFKGLGGKGAAEFKGRPAWWRTVFTLDSVESALYFEAIGLSKGQVFVNGHNAGRYFVSTRSGKAVGGQSRYYLPEPWLKAGPNELMLFDEHGFSPERSRVVL
ncbi:MAG: beta galactosidase jelly roll domain-containing protein, partial [Phycisphaerae bacterium]|nr:beta galactosidase jelly roll domain-containing protein [Phycisphaerae bacterium]